MSEKCPGGKGKIDLTLYESNFGLKMGLGKNTSKVELVSQRTVSYLLNCQECSIHRTFTVHGGDNALDDAHQQAMNACPKRLGAKK